jgi:small subunit ribosomal protein S20
LPNHKSCKKRMKTSALARVRNRSTRSELRAALRDLKALPDKKTAAVQFTSVSSLLDKAAASGIIHKKNASRNKSRLALFVAQLP